MRLRRIVIIAAAVFLVGIGSWVGYGVYQERANNPLNQVVIDVNGVKFDMRYYINAIAAYTNMYGWNSSVISNYGNVVADLVADNIVNGESLKQAAPGLNFTVTSDELNTALKQYGWPNSPAYEDIMTATLLDKKVSDYFGAQLPDSMEQAHIQAALVESEDVANEVITQVNAGGNFTALANLLSYNSSVKGDLGWLPDELMPNALVANAAFNGTIGQISQIYDQAAVKDVGYWLIQVSAKQGNQIDVRAMLLGSETEAEQIKADLAAGGNFSALAAEHSQYQSNNSTGELGWKKKGDMKSTAFDNVAFNLPLNQVSDPVKDLSVHTTGGYWLVNLVDRGNVALSDTVKQKLIDNRYNEWLGNWTKQNTINTYLDATKKQWAINQLLAAMSSTSS